MSYTNSLYNAVMLVDKTLKFFFAEFAWKKSSFIGDGNAFVFAHKLKASKLLF